MSIDANELLSCLFTASLLISVIAGATPRSASMVQQWGQLSVTKGRLCDEKGNPVQLKGMSTHGLQYWPVSKSTIDHLVDDWHCTVIRAAMYTAEKGYVDNHAMMRDRVKLVVDECIVKGIYVIIDWHILSDNNPNEYREEAKDFFDEISRSYGKYPNVLYEICNEPHDCSWADDIKPYAEYIIPVIRANDPDGVIICGNENWSSAPQLAADNPLPCPNILYTLHYYAATHNVDQYMQRMESCMSKGYGVFVSEWGICEASGSGRIDLSSSQKMAAFLAEKKVSWCLWSLSPGSNSSDVFEPGVSLDGPWSNDQLSTTGKFAKENIIGDGSGF